MAVKTNITINIVEPGSNVPVPDTGLFTHGIGSTLYNKRLPPLIFTSFSAITNLHNSREEKAFWRKSVEKPGRSESVRYLFGHIIIL